MAKKQGPCATRAAQNRTKTPYTNASPDEKANSKFRFLKRFESIGQAKYLPAFWRYFRAIRESQWWPQEQLMEYQNQKIRALVSHAYENVPYYGRLFSEYGITPKDIQCREDLVKIPILTKKAIRENQADLLAKNIPAKDRMEYHTSGSTGEPLIVKMNRDASIRDFAFEIRHRTWIPKHRLWRPIAILRSYVPRPGAPPYKYDIQRHAYYFSPFRMDKDNLKLYADIMKRKKLRVLRAYPSSAYIFAEFLQQKNIDFPLDGVITSSETLLPQYRETIEEQFGCKVFDWYGVNERVAIAQQCECSTYHVNMEYGIFDIEKSKSLPADKGRVVGTSLHNYVMPLIRYDVGDVAIRAKKGKKCVCGRELEHIGGVIGRQDDFLSTPDGKIVPPLNFYRLFGEYSKAVRAFQLYQEDRNRLEVRLVKSSDYNQNAENELLAGVRERLGNAIKINMVYLEEIPRDKKTGKVRAAISKVPIEF